MSDLESLRPLYEAATAKTVDGLTAAEELVKAVGRLLDQPEAHPTRIEYDVEMFAGRDGADPGDGDLWIGAGAGSRGHETVDTARGFRRLRRRDMHTYPPMRIVEIRTTYTVIETEEKGTPYGHEY